MEELDRQLQRHQKHCREHSKVKPLSQIGDWSLTKTIGKGSMGKVKIAVNGKTSEKRACKIIPIKGTTGHIGPTSSIRDIPGSSLHNKITKASNRSSASLNDHSKEFRIIREAAIMLLLDHPHIVTLHEIHLIDSYFYLFFDLVNGGQMLDFIISHGKLKEKIARKYMRQIVSAVDYCHHNSIAHRDLKIENILIDQNGMIKLIDFGLSNLYSPNSLLNTFCGSLYFAAPELLAARSYMGPEVDIWSLGVILFVLVCGHVPFDDTSMPVLHAKIKAGVIEFPNHLSTECKNLISMMLQPNPANRCSMDDIKYNSWFTKGYDGPPDNFLPSRSPVELPIDDEVVKRMKGFGFGTDEEITDKISNIIKARSLKTQQLDSLKQSGSFFKAPQKFDLKGVGRALIHRSDKGSKSTIPENSIMSIYYLVSEKMERDLIAGKTVIENKSKRVVRKTTMDGLEVPEIEFAQASNDLLPSSMDGSVQDLEENNYDDGPSISFSAPSSPTMSRRSLHLVDVSKARRVRPRAASMGELVIPSYLKSPDNSRTFKRVASTGFEQKQISRSPNLRKSPKPGSPAEFIEPSIGGEVFSDGEVEMTESTGTASLKNNLVSAVKKRFSRFSSSSDKPRPVMLVDEPSSPPRETDPISPLDGVSPIGSPPVETRRKTYKKSRNSRKHFSRSNSSQKPEFSSSNSNSKKLSKRISMATALQFSKDKSAGSAQDDTTPETPIESAKPIGQVDSHVKNVFLKGLFSVVTSSTKSAASIRKELLRVFGLLELDFKESSGVFECRYGTYRSTLDPISKSPPQGTSYTSTSPMEIDEGEISADEEDNRGIKWESAKSVVFEVYIVKIGWVGLRGIRFRRISGNSWQYKKICNRILEESRL